MFRFQVHISTRLFSNLHILTLYFFLPTILFPPYILFQPYNQLPYTTMASGTEAYSTGPVTNPPDLYYRPGFYHYEGRQRSYVYMNLYGPGPVEPPDAVPTDGEELQRQLSKKTRNNPIVLVESGGETSGGERTERIKSRYEFAWVRIVTRLINE